MMYGLRPVEEEAVDMKRQQKKRAREYRIVRQKIEGLELERYWTKEYYACYLRSLCHLDKCNFIKKINPPRCWPTLEKVIEMDVLCERTLDDYDLLLDSMNMWNDECSRRYRDVNPPLTRAVVEINRDHCRNILLRNKRHEFIFNRCNKKRFPYDPDCLVPMEKITDFIQHYLFFGKNVLPSTMQTMEEIDKKLKERRLLEIKDVSNETFYRVRQMMQERIEFPIDQVDYIENPYMHFRDIKLSFENLNLLEDFFERDRVQAVRNKLLLDGTISDIDNDSVRQTVEIIDITGEIPTVESQEVAKKQKSQTIQREQQTEKVQEAAANSDKASSSKKVKVQSDDMTQSVAVDSPACSTEPENKKRAVLTTKKNKSNRK